MIAIRLWIYYIGVGCISFVVSAFITALIHYIIWKFKIKIETNLDYLLILDELNYLSEISGLSKSDKNHNKKTIDHFRKNLVDRRSVPEKPSLPMESN